MKRLIARLASLELAVVLLVLLLLGLAAGTILESSRGSEVAGRYVYYASWFLALEVAFAINVLASIALHFPWGSQRIGYLLTHGALAVILIGAATTFLAKREGQLELWEGQTGNQIVRYDREQHVSVRVELPFSIKLDDFRVSYYPGTMRPANFQSDVQVVDATGHARSEGIWMNHPLTVDGWRFFQSSYRQERWREATVLSVSKDPGQPIVFAGYGLLIAGMTTVLGTRAAQSRRRAKPVATLPKQPKRAAEHRHAKIAAGLVLGALACGSHPARAADATLAALARLPVQHDGRVMPLDTLAREAVWNVTGDHAWRGADPVATVTSWAFARDAAAQAPVVKIGSAQLAAAAGLATTTTHASFQQLVSSRAVLGLIERAHQAEENHQPRSGVLAAAEKLENRLLWLQRFLDGSAIRPIPAADVNAKWGVPASVDAPTLLGLANGPRLAGWPAASAIQREIVLNAVHPMRIAGIVLALALAASLAGWNRGSRALDAVALTGLVTGFATLTWGIGMRWLVAGRIPASNLYESLLFLAWGVGLFAVLALIGIRNRLVVLNAAALGAFTLLLTDQLPIDGFVHPVAPVLAGTPWLAIHVPIIMVSYAVLALGVVVAHMEIGYRIFSPKRTELIGRMSELLYWYVLIGSMLLVTGILTGSMWAASSWGRYWGWDPKEVWSLVAFLAYVAILHARWNGMLSRFGVAAMSIVAFQAILMTYLGVNFVLTTGMHSYGFGDSPIVAWMIAVATAEGAFLALGLVARRKYGHGPRLAVAR